MSDQDVAEWTEIRVETTETNDTDSGSAPSLRDEAAGEPASESANDESDPHSTSTEQKLLPPAPTPITVAQPSMTVAECEEHISRIRQEKGLDGRSSSVVEDLEASLDILSDQLYTESTHFMLELIQNADDNTYAEGVVPEIAFCYRSDGLFFIGCNEVGFSRKNVEAICRISQSTKKAQRGSDGYIGEKGIGFKSVFKVADEVWIKSGNYSFKFDRTKQLGMIAPFLAEMPKSTLTQQTIICLNLREKAHRQTIKTELGNLTPTLLIFLRRLSKITIMEMEASKSRVTKHVVISRKRIDEGAYHVVETNDEDQLSPRAKFARYVVTDFKVENMPEERKRAQTKSSRMVLAFPVDKDWKPIVAEQQVYAHLPIRSFGFKFLVQADFLLVANREDIDRSLDWNWRLRDSLVDAFINAVYVLDETKLKYTWAKYLPREKGSPKSFLFPVFKELKDRLRQEPILETIDGDYDTPAVVMHVPKDFKDDSGLPLLATDFDENEEDERPAASKSKLRATPYLAPEYVYSDVAILDVANMTGTVFITQLRKFTTSLKDEYYNRPVAWHIKLARAIMEAASSSKSLKEAVQNIPLIPIRGNSAMGAPNKLKDFYFSGAFPEGIKVNIIETVAAQNSDRRKLFDWLGAKTLNQTGVCDLLIREHHVSKPRDWTVEMLVSHANYLYTAFCEGAVINRHLHFYVAVNGDTVPSLAQNVYLNRPGSRQTPASAYFSPRSGPLISVPFLHPAYLAFYQGEAQGRWIDFLVFLGVSAFPRLRNTDRSSMTTEFRSILQHCPTSLKLACLNENWNYYSLYPIPPNDMKPLERELRGVISATEVDCLDGKKAPLSDTVLPHLRKLSPLASAAGIKFLDVPTSISIEKSNLPKFSSLGVVTSANVDFYMSILVGLARTKKLPERFEMAKLYDSIHESCSGDMAAQDAVHARFSKEALVYLPKTTNMPGRWVPMQDCAWNAPACLRSIQPLAGIWKDRELFFTRTLRIRNASVTSILEALIGRKGELNNVEVIKELLLAMGEELKRPTEKYDLTPMERADVFPVRTSRSVCKLVSAFDVWFIPDRKREREAFEGHVALLDFTSAQQETLQLLFHKLNLTRRMLSGNVMESREKVGQATLNYDLTVSLREKAQYLVCLALPAEQIRLQKALKTLEIFSVTAVVLRRTVRIGNAEVQGTDEHAGVYVGAGLKIYVAEADIRSNRVNYYRICEGLSDFCKVGGNHQRLVNSIIYSRSVEEIEDILENNGFNIEKRLKKEEIKVVAPKVVSQVAMPPSQSLIAGAANTAVVAPQHAPIVASGSVSSITCADAAVLPALPASGAVPAVRKLPRSARDALPVELQRDIDQGSRLDPSKPSPSDGPVPPANTQASTMAKAGMPPLKSNRPSVLSIALETTELTASHRAGTTNRVTPLRTFNSRDYESDSVDGSSSGPRRPSSRPWSRDSAQDSITSEDLEEILRIGKKGECVMFYTLKELLGDEFTESCWTSETRGQFFPNKPFDKHEADFTDFTFKDVTGKFAAKLAEDYYPAAKNWKHLQLNFHVEIKATNSGEEEPFYMSQNQVNMARRYNLHDNPVPKHVYVLIRVYDLERKPRWTVYVDPWTMFLKNEMCLDAAEGYRVWKC